MAEREHLMNRAALTRRREGAYEETGATAWPYLMLSPQQSRLILRRIVTGPRSGNTLAVWEAARSYAEWNTGQIVATVAQLAEDAGTTPTEVYRALSQLVEVGALVRTGRGRYALNAKVAWFGTK